MAVALVKGSRLIAGSVPYPQKALLGVGLPAKIAGIRLK
jgi:hypothetical protein